LERELNLNLTAFINACAATGLEKVGGARPFCSAGAGSGRSLLNFTHEL